jgi:acetyl-CoA acyltransferase
MSDSDVFIVSAVRTAIGSGKETGALRPLHPVELTALVMREAVQRAGVYLDPLNDLYLAPVFK